MPSNKYSPRRRSHKRPPICISKPPQPPERPYYPPYFYATDTIPEGLRYHLSRAVPPPPKPPFPPIRKRNLIAHIYAPLSNDEWKRTAKALSRHWDLFNGIQILAIPTGPGLLRPDRVREYFPPSAIPFILPNDERLREVASFLPLLKRVQSADSTRATFYCHTKGGSPFNADHSRQRHAIRYWCDHMFRECLTHWPICRFHLKTHATAGTFRISYHKLPDFIMQSPTGMKWGTWHYAGTFFWFRHDAIFRRPQWSAIPDDPFAAEMWLGSFIPHELAAAIPPSWEPPVTMPPDLYDPSTYDNF